MGKVKQYLTPEEQELTDLIYQRIEIEMKITELYKKLTGRYSGKGCEFTKEEDIEIPTGRINLPLKCYQSIPIFESKHEEEE